MKIKKIATVMLLCAIGTLAHTELANADAALPVEVKMGTETADENHHLTQTARFKNHVLTGGNLVASDSSSLSSLTGSLGLPYPIEPPPESLKIWTHEGYYEGYYEIGSRFETDPYTEGSKFSFKLERSSNFLYDYVITLDVKTPAKYTFTDATGDHYNLTAILQGSHTVRFNSRNPSIVSGLFTIESA